MSVPIRRAFGSFAARHRLPYAVVLATILLMSSGMLVAASIPDSTTGVISGCYTSSTLRIIDAQAGETCRKGELPLAWNQRGPIGPSGPPGPKGDQGPAGVVSLATLQDTACTRHDGTTGYVDVAVDSSNVITLSCAYGVPHWCDAHTPTVGPHLNVTCDEATDTLTFYCDIGWVNFDGDIANGCEVEGFEPTTTAVQAFADAYVIGGHDVAIPPSCGGDITIACPGGVPMDPPPTVHIDGSNLVITDLGNDEFSISLDVGIRASGIPIDGSGLECSLAADTSAGTYPNAVLQGDVTFLVNPTTGVTDRIQTTNASLGHFESADITISGGVGCDIADALKGFALDLIKADFESYLDQTICRAPDPEIFELCPASP